MAMFRATIAPVTAFLLAYSGEASATDTSPTEADLVASSPADTYSSIATANAEETSGWGVACRAACWSAAGAGCAAVSVVCTAGTVFTVGGTSIPCSWAIIAACTAGGGGASVCADKLCPP
jgi:hypothetical protein